ncbi:MAG: hypothetical protein RLZZ241_2500 [Bacteroidota bacterium]|jgi:carboxyl-terminal processing protease
MKPHKTTKVIAVGTLILFSLTAVSFKTNLFEIAKQLEIFTSVYRAIHLNYVDETNPAALVESAIKNMLVDLDPYTVYLNEQDAEGLKMAQAGAYAGIGAEVRLVEDHLVIVEVYEGMPADVAGLKAGDEIVSIGGLHVRDFQSDALELLKGNPGDVVSLSCRNKETLREVSVVISAQEPKAVPFFGMTTNQTGYLVLTRFSATAAQEVREAVLALKESGATQLILDLRDNPGGLLAEAIAIVNLFIPKDELVVFTQSNIEEFNQTYKTRQEPLDAQIPLAILINGNSASASEIVAGSLQDLDRAVVLGGKSFGKGLVQRQLPLTYGTQLKVTISRYFTPSGRCIQALNYRVRDNSGQATKKSSFNSFRTRNGRVVADGGGISPDVLIPIESSGLLLSAIIEKHLIFEFANHYVQQHSFSSIADFVFTDSDYADFVAFANVKGFVFETPQETELKRIFAEPSDFSGIPDAQTAYRSLLLSFEKGRQMAYETFEPQLKRALAAEIVKRQFYKSGQFQYALMRDETILTARTLLNDSKRYSDLLN